MHQLFGPVIDVFCGKGRAGAQPRSWAGLVATANSNWGRSKNCPATRRLGGGGGKEQRHLPIIALIKALKLLKKSLSLRCVDMQSNLEPNPKITTGKRRFRKEKSWMFWIEFCRENSQNTCPCNTQTTSKLVGLLTEEFRLTVSKHIYIMQKFMSSPDKRGVSFRNHLKVHLQNLTLLQCLQNHNVANNGYS